MGTLTTRITPSFGAAPNSISITTSSFGSSAERARSDRNTGSRLTRPFKKLDRNLKILSLWTMLVAISRLLSAGRQVSVAKRGSLSTYYCAVRYEQYYIKAYGAPSLSDALFDSIRELS